MCGKGGEGCFRSRKIGQALLPVVVVPYVFRPDIMLITCHFEGIYPGCVPPHPVYTSYPYMDKLE
jgi:hypothetical protein